MDADIAVRNSYWLSVADRVVESSSQLSPEERPNIRPIIPSLHQIPLLFGSYRPPCREKLQRPIEPRIGDDGEAVEEAPGNET